MMQVQQAVAIKQRGLQRRHIVVGAIAPKRANLGAQILHMREDHGRSHSRASRGGACLISDFQEEDVNIQEEDKIVSERGT